MPFSTGLAVLTQATHVTARAKLPDDLILGEYSDLVAAFTTLMHVAAHAGGEQRFETGELRSAAPIQIDRAQYGSDFMVVVAIVSATAAAGGAIAGVALGISKSLKTIAEAGLINEQRLALRDERMQRRKERRAAEQAVRRMAVGTPVELEVLLPPAARALIDDALESPKRWEREVYISIGLLAEYGVQVEVWED